MTMPNAQHPIKYLSELTEEEYNSARTDAITVGMRD